MLVQQRVVRSLDVRVPRSNSTSLGNKTDSASANLPKVTSSRWGTLAAGLGTGLDAGRRALWSFNEGVGEVCAG